MDEITRTDNNMPENNDFTDQINKYPAEVIDLKAENDSLKDENERLKTKNAKLYNDCVSFAKKIKANEDHFSRVSELEAEVERLKNEVEVLRMTSNVDPTLSTDATSHSIDFSNVKPMFSPPPLDKTFEPTEMFTDGAELIENVTKLISDEDNFLTNQEKETKKGKEKKAKVPKNHVIEEKGSVFRKIVKGLIWVLFIFSLLISLASGITYLLTHQYSNYTIAGYRFATVINDSMHPDVSKGSAVLVKYTSLEDSIPIDSLVITTKDKRSVGKIIALDASGSATIADKSGNYEIQDTQLIGLVVFVVPYLGEIVAYASTNPYHYLTIVASATLILLALLIIIPTKKVKKPKFGKDYTVEDFTI
ncbi:MAG: hypothetical protein GX241_04730 [Ruminococcaceae bacterium]|nr:hypothetical protein [Oscillospiraceae bacterium]